MAAAAGVNPFQFEVSDAHGVKIASRDDGAPTTSLALVIRGGSRYETAPGLAHALQQFTWKVGPMGIAGGFDGLGNTDMESQ